MNRVTCRSDVTVVGGGLAGVAAAIAAARSGATVALVNNRPVLGGNSSSEIRVWVVGATAHGAQKYARETGIMGELFLENQWRNPEGNPVLWDHVVLDLVRAEPNIALYLNTDVREVDAVGEERQRTIRSVRGWQMGSERLITFESPVFIDCTGDGLVGALAGARFAKGREPRESFGESLAPVVADDNMLGSTILLYTKDAGEPVVFVAPESARDIVPTGIPVRRQIDTAMNGCDYWWIEWGGELDAVDDNESIRDELWGVVFGIWDHIKNSGEFDADTLTLEWVGTIPGKREYRRFLGDHVLTEGDILDQTRFPDVVGFGGWSIDLHPAGGMYAEDGPSAHLFGPGLYEIPFRSLYSVNVDNMLMAGRDISASHVAFGSTRVMATCAVLGEAAGAGAALAARLGVSPREVANRHIDELQQHLLRSDASILGVARDDPADLARTATASATRVVDLLAVPRSPSGEQLVSLAEGDFGLVLPADPRLDSVTFEVVATAPGTLSWELWSTRNGLNHIPVDRIVGGSVGVSGELRQSIDIPTGYSPERPCSVVLVLRAHPSVSLVSVAGPAPYGVMGLLRRDPKLAHGTAQSNAWSAFELRRRCVVFSARPATEAYSPSQAIRGGQRPFDGPDLWASVLPAGEAAVLELAWLAPVRAGRVELVFNDDVDEDLINLHHHRTPERVLPTLVRDYHVECRTAEGWVTMTTVTDNRRRRRVHLFDEPVETDRLRLVVTATNGHPHAMVGALRVFA